MRPYYASLPQRPPTSTRKNEGSSNTRLCPAPAHRSGKVSGHPAAARMRHSRFPRDPARTDRSPCIRPLVHIPMYLSLLVPRKHTTYTGLLHNQLKTHFTSPTCECAVLPSFTMEAVITTCRPDLRVTLARTCFGSVIPLCPRYPQPAREIPPSPWSPSVLLHKRSQLYMYTHHLSPRLVNEQKSSNKDTKGNDTFST